MGAFIRTNKNGAILVWVMVAITLILSTIYAGVSLIQNTSDIMDSQMEYYGQTNGMAKAGLLDALAYFRRQTTQPVTIFNPQLITDTAPIVNDTDDPNIGIMRQLDVAQTRSIYGRYEVDKTIVRDISAERGLTGSGTLWYIESRGIIYLQLDPNQAYNVWPNRIIGSLRLATEIRRVSMVLPSSAALCTRLPNQTIIGNNSKVLAEAGYGIVYPPAAGTPTTAGATVTGTLGAMSSVSPYSDSCEQVFGLPEETLHSIADYYVTDIAQLPIQIPSYKIVFFDGNATFNASHPLKGTGIFYITGNLTIAVGSFSSYNGIIYCKGTYQQNAPSLICGSIITLGQVNVTSTADISEIDYDADVLQQVETYTGQYRLAKGFYKIE